MPMPQPLRVNIPIIVQCKQVHKELRYGAVGRDGVFTYRAFVDEKEMGQRELCVHSLFIFGEDFGAFESVQR